jgi:hypothetical protein
MIEKLVMFNVCCLAVFGLWYSGIAYKDIPSFGNMVVPPNIVASIVMVSSELLGADHGPQAMSGCQWHRYGELSLKVGNHHSTMM